jgi:diguanylate cyclase (GGDEF)-like protein
MKLSVSRIALIGSLRSRIVVIISLLTIAVQLAIYAIVDRTNKDFEQSHALSMSERIDDVASTVVNSEYQTLEYQLVKFTNQIPQNAAVGDVAALVDRRNNDSTDSRHFFLRNARGDVLNNESRFSAENLPLIESASATRSGFFEDGQAFLVATSSLANLRGYQLAVASGADDHVLPQIEKLTQIDAKAVRHNGEQSAARSGEVTIAEFPEASIVGMYQGSPALKGLISQQQARLQILMASSLVIVLLLGMALARELTKPLKMLVDATRKIKNGDYSVKVEMLHQDEIGELAKTIDMMREHVGEREDEILKLAYADTLTELPNRALFDDRLNQTVMQGQRRQEAFAVVILDMDRFKYINDVLGHESGDFVLKEVASRLKLTLRKSDTVARLGGDEFALLLQDVTEQDILSAVDRIAGAFEHPVTLNNQPIDIGCSIGIAKYPEHGEDASTLLRRADMAMYSAKRSDTVFAFYDPNCDEHREEHLSLLSEIKRAIEKDELQLFFQPKVTFDDSSILSVETLLRWQHPKRGLIPPDEFIPFAEQTGAIRLITRWLIAKATVQARNWADQGLMVKMSLNISARDLLDSDFSGYIKKRLDENEVDPAMICMEITESALMEDPIKARRTVEELHQLGLSISIDDYGTGYSSLAYVKNLPVNELKIDREFIKNMLENKEDVAIVRSTIELGHNLGLKVVAEGIEREEEMQMLKDFGCDQAQGYLISKALTASDMEAWISKNRPGDDKDGDEPPLLQSVG